MCIVFYFFQHFFFFRPEILPKSFQYNYPFPFEEIDFQMEDGGRINAIYFQVPNSQGIIYYLKGNSRSIKGWGKFAKDFLSNGYDFIMFDYRGFGKSSGKRNEQILYSDAQYVFKWINERYESHQILIYGRSLGSGIAARIASWNKVKALVLDSPYYSFYHNIRRWGFILPIRFLLRYNIRTDRYISQINCPIYIIHGNRDRLFPISQSKDLVKLSGGKIQLLEIEGAGHNNLPDFPDYHNYLFNIMNGISPIRELTYADKQDF